MNSSPPLLLALLGAFALSCAAWRSGGLAEAAPAEEALPADAAALAGDTGGASGRRVGLQILEQTVAIGGSSERGFGSAVVSGAFGDGRQPVVAVGSPDEGAGSVAFFSVEGDPIGHAWGAVAGEGAGSGLVVGDLDGDGHEDLVVGMRSRRVADEEPGEEAGGLYVVPGPLAGDFGLAEVGTRWVGEADDKVGGPMAVGDVDGDEVLDLIVGAGRSAQGAWLGGAVYVLRGGLAAQGCGGAEPCALAAEGELVVGTIEREHAGSSVAVGDFDGDGIDDILTGAFSAENAAGAAYLVSGPVHSDRDLPADAVLRVVGSTSFDLLGYAVAMPDLDGDGRAEAVIGAPGQDDTGPEAGSVLVFDRPGQGLTESDARASLGAMAFARSGWSVEGAGDLDADGHGDLVIGAPGDVGGRGAGWVVYGPLSGSRIFDRDQDATWRAEVAPAGLGGRVDMGPAGLLLSAPEVGLVLLADPFPTAPGSLELSP